MKKLHHLLMCIRTRLTALSPLLLMILVSAKGNLSYGSGISTNQAEVKLEKLWLGRTYQLSYLTGSLLTCKNNNNEPLDLSFFIELPEKDSLKPGYEALPDISWIQLAETSFIEVPPGETAQTDFVIKIPRERKFRGKKFQFYIVMKTAPLGQVALALRSRFLITIAQTRREGKKGEH